MNNEGLISVRFWMWLFLGFCLFVFLCGISLSNNIEARIKKVRPLVKEILQMEYPDPDKIEAFINATTISGTRG